MIKKRQLGFTLIEVMVAVAIFALAGGAVLKAVSEHARSVTTLERVTFATFVADNQLTRASLESKIKWPLDKRIRGEAQIAGRTFYWQRDAEKTADESLYQVTVTVASDQAMENAITSVVTFMTKVNG